MEEDGLTIVLTPPQLAMVLSNGTFEEPTFSNRAWGSAGAIFGALEVLGGGALLLMPEPTTLTKFGGGLLTAHGTDTFQAGVRQAWTGLETNTLTNDGATALAELLGVDRATAERIGRGVDLVVPLVVASGLAAARIATIRAGRISLATHEAYGGHTIARHVGLTEEQLRARLGQYPNLPAASSFASLAEAEKAVALGLRANRSVIAKWARTATPGDTQDFLWAAPSRIGMGVVRATGEYVPMSKVRIVLMKKAIDGKIYYVFSAYPTIF
ncbi:Uncharacterised protein [Bordetella ansorpii]|uniref:Bacterial CdiA-CT RNAse A domain-containing protein n=1 Tax=Bordetella ansorpii TaxID=288768 RepID=A0A157SEH7_9BORD|nr:RNase A-like domain-containing protein [Bordetella ansorpii]SAI68326.1 Uncharacterised protein [Bordetella ansorpii]